MTTLTSDDKILIYRALKEYRGICLVDLEMLVSKKSLSDEAIAYERKRIDTLGDLIDRLDIEVVL